MKSNYFSGLLVCLAVLVEPFPLLSEEPTLSVRIESPALARFSDSSSINCAAIFFNKGKEEVRIDIPRQRSNMIVLAGKDGSLIDRSAPYVNDRFESLIIPSNSSARVDVLIDLSEYSFKVDLNPVSALFILDKKRNGPFLSAEEVQTDWSRSISKFRESVFIFAEIFIIIQAVKSNEGGSNP